ncbi:MAG: glycosyltransferase family 1 protein [Gemmatimonadales bacterium]
MRIGVDATCWANQRGYGRYARHIVGAMVEASPLDEFVCFLDELSAANFSLDQPNVRRVIVKTSAGAAAAASADGSRSLSDMFAMTRAVWRNRVDVFYSPSVYTYFPLPPGLPAIVTIHDAIADRFPELTLPSPRARFFWRAKNWLAHWQARSILTVSDYAAGEVSRQHGVTLSKIDVTLEGPAPAFRPIDQSKTNEVAARHGIPIGATWFIYVGGFNPHKHVVSIVAAHGELSKTLAGGGPRLLLVGNASSDVFHSEVNVIRAMIEKCGTESTVDWLGYVEDGELAALLSGAIALVLASESEGFGLPAIEAAACATPVIATTESPLPDLLRGGGLFVPPGDSTAIVAAMKLLLNDPQFRNKCGQTALEQAQKLSWEKSADICLAAIRKAAA